MDEAAQEREKARLRVLPTEEYFSLIKAQLAQSGRAFVRVTGISMMPLLRHLRDGVILVPPKGIRPGDIVLFDRRNGRYALHRVIGMGKAGFAMAGDNQWHMERKLPYDQIVGKVSVICRDGKEIPTNKFSLKIYFQAVRLLAYPRIYGCRAARKLLRPILKLRKRPKAGERKED